MPTPRAIPGEPFAVRRPLAFLPQALGYASQGGFAGTLHLDSLGASRLQFDRLSPKYGRHPQEDRMTGSFPANATANSQTWLHASSIVASRLVEKPLEGSPECANNHFRPDISVLSVN